MRVTLPHGETFVSMIVAHGDLYITSTSRLWVLEKGTLVPVEIRDESDEPEETQVFTDEKLADQP